MIDQHDPIAQDQPVQPSLCQWKLLVGRQQPYASPGHADLQLEKLRGAVGEGEGQPGIRLLPTGLQMAQRQERIQERAHEDEERKHYDTPRQTINIGMVSLACPSKALSPAPPA